MGATFALALVARLFGGSLYLYDVEGSTRRCWTGSLVSPCVLLSRPVFLFWWLLVVGIVRLWGMNKGGLSACAAPANRVDGRAAAACLCGAESPSPVFVVARFWVSSREREGGRRHFSSVSRSLHRLCVRNVFCVREYTNMVVTTTTTT